MKTLLIINGPPGAGKSAVCSVLYKSLDRCVWLDGDWCWMMNPFAATEENKRMVEDNITHLLRNFLASSSFETVLFSWVMPREEICAALLARLEGLEFRPVRITLVCSESVLRQRMAAQGRMPEQIENSAARLAEYRAMNTIKVDTSALDAAAAAETIRKLLD